MERDTGETDENVNREEEDVENHRKSAPLHLFVKLVRQQKSKTCHACEREKEKKSTWSEVHIISKRPVTTRLYGVAMGKKRKEKPKKILCFFSSIGIAAFFLTTTGAKN